MLNLRNLKYLLIPALLFMAADACCDDPKILKVETKKSSIQQFELFELEITASGEFKNPHDPDEIDISAEISGPSESRITVPAFFTGRGSEWKVRYTPAVPGKFSYRVLLKTPSSNFITHTYYFSVRPGGDNGFVRISKNNPNYLAFDSGKPFFGIGHNIAWTPSNSLTIFEKYFKDFEANGCNLTRVWINNPWAFFIEDKFGSYNVANSDKFDALLDSAAGYSIYMIVVLDSYGSLMEEKGPWSENTWKTNPYNKINGGPCEKPWDFFSDNTAKAYYKKRLRYIIARWGYSPNILAFELWNEADAPRDWTQEMAAYAKSINPHGQLIMTSLGYPWANNFDESGIWALKEIDAIDRHLYGNMSNDIVGNILSVNKELVKKYRKPLIIGEFGMDQCKDDNACDSAGCAIELHNSLWASAVSGAMGGALNWWWDTYVSPKKLYSHYKAFADFTRDVNWNGSQMEFAKTTPVMRLPEKKAKRSYSDIAIGTVDKWGDATYKEFTIMNDGEVTGGLVNYYLHGAAKPDMRIEPSFKVNYPVDGKLILEIGTVSQGANLVVYIDDKEVFNKEFPAGPGVGPWKKSLYRADYKIYQAIYDMPIELEVSRGGHTIRLANTGDDWIGVKKIRLINYSSNSFTSARAYGIDVDKQMLFWIQNRESSWQMSVNGSAPSVINNAGFSVEDIDNGLYSVEWWDTFKGVVTAREKVTAKNRTAFIQPPAFSKDIACKIKKIKTEPIFSQMPLSLKSPAAQKDLSRR